MITATGKVDGKLVKVVYDDGRFTFNGEIDEFYRDLMQIRLEHRYPIGGTYYTDDPMDVLNIMNVLRYHFFDRSTEIDIQDETIPEMPYEEGVIY